MSHPSDRGKTSPSRNKTTGEPFEPFELHNPIPWPIIAIALALAAWGLFTFVFSDMAAESNQEKAEKTAEQAGAQQTNEQDTAAIDGAALFDSYCSSCHQSNGAGISQVIPPLVGSSWVLGDGAQTASILLKGINGPIIVAGNTYNGRMPTFGDTLNDNEIAAIVSFIRSSWGNNAGAVSAETVRTQRQRWRERDEPWRSGAELRAKFTANTTAGSN